MVADRVRRRGQRQRMLDLGRFHAGLSSTADAPSRQIGPQRDRRTRAGWTTSARPDRPAARPRCSSAVAMPLARRRARGRRYSRSSKASAIRSLTSRSPFPPRSEKRGRLSRRIVFSYYQNDNAGSRGGPWPSRTCSSMRRCLGSSKRPPTRGPTCWPRMNAVFPTGAGQFCTFKVHVDGEDLYRSYSMSSAPETGFRDGNHRQADVPAARCRTGCSTTSSRATR